MFNRSEQTNILLAARMCEVVYQSFGSAAFGAWATPYKTAETWIEGNAEAMGVVVGDDLFIAIRGTEPKKLKDWMSDACAAPSPFDEFAKGATVHRGFETYALVLIDHIQTFVLKHPGKRVILTGHSLGGSAAILCAAHLLLAGCRCRVITFGAAPVGNNKFRRAYNRGLQNNTLRFEYAGDIVPRLPVLAPWLKHVSRRLYLPFFGRRIRVNPKRISRWSDIVGRRIIAIASVRPFSGVKDHGMALYRKRLRRAFR